MNDGRTRKMTAPGEPAARPNERPRTQVLPEAAHAQPAKQTQLEPGLAREGAAAARARESAPAPEGQARDGGPALARDGSPEGQAREGAAVQAREGVPAAQAREGVPAAQTRDGAPEGRAPGLAPPRGDASRDATRPYPLPTARLRVQKTYKLFVGGQFVRSESGRYTALADEGGETMGATENVPRASRKDARDAVRAALAAQPGWAGRTAFNRAQIVYRLAEVVESRMGELTWELARASGTSPEFARREVGLAIDHVVSAAGWCDKFQSLLGAENPAAGPFLNVSFAEPMGVVAVVAPALPSLLGLVDALLPPLVAGNASVVLVSERDPRTALTFGECLATSDLPGGVVNLLSGQVAEVAPHLAKHQEVNALSLWTDDDDLARSLEEAAAGSVKRVRRFLPRPAVLESPPPGLFDIEAFCETKTVWHPAGR
ncbi:MAG TPA: aldehyde dehydrogenase family protein [Polyangiaceae bacterium]|nr:aldehyde dehydrogenase family protein [Polyangiaceae bacterium]